MIQVLRSKSRIPSVAFQIIDSKFSVTYARQCFKIRYGGVWLPEIGFQTLCARRCVLGVVFQKLCFRFSVPEVVVQTACFRLCSTSCVPDSVFQTSLSRLSWPSFRSSSCRLTVFVSEGRSRDGVGLQAAPRSPFSPGPEGRR